MRVGVAILFSAVISVLATLVIVRSADQVEMVRELGAKDQLHQQEKSKMERQLRSAKQKSGRVQMIENRVVTRAPQPQDAGEIIAQLGDLRLQGGNRFAVQRRLIYGLESLADLGAAAIADINDYLASGSDVDYAKLGMVNEQVNLANWNWSGSATVKRDSTATPEDAVKKAAEDQLRYQDSYRLGPTEYLCPPTLRLGVIETLGAIGGEASEQSILEVLRAVQSAKELVLIDRLLEQMSPGKYLKDVLSVAREGLAKARSQAGTNSEEWREDWSQRSRYYALLIKHGDASFANEAQAQLVMANGQIDNEALTYLQRVLKEKSVLYFIDTIKNVDETKAGYSAQYLSSAILRYAGEHDAADQFLLDTLKGTQKTQAKTTILYGLCQAPLSQEGAIRRLQLLDKAEQSSTDESLKQHFQGVRRTLEYYRDPKSNRMTLGNGSVEWKTSEGLKVFQSGGGAAPGTIIVQPRR